MRFHASEEQLAIQDVLRRALDDCLGVERLLALRAERLALDPASWTAVMELGLGGLALPEAHGGSGLGLVDAAMAVEAVGEKAMPGPVVEHLTAGLALAACGDEALKARWLPALAEGRAVASVALGGGWTPQSWDVAFDGTGVSGSVRFVPGGAAADVLLVGVAGGGLVLAERGEGVDVMPLAAADMTRGLASVAFTGAKAVPLFAAGDPEAQRVFDAALVLSAADALGGAQHCLDQAVAYAKERRQFDRPIGQFQALKHQLATMALEVETARALSWYAAYAWDARLPDASRAAATAKAHLADRFTATARAAVAAHGGVGYTWEYGLTVWFRRALFDYAYLGPPALHRARMADLAGW